MKVKVFSAALVAASVIGSGASAMTLGNIDWVGEWDNFDVPAGLSGGDGNAGALDVTATLAGGSTYSFLAYCADLQVPIIQGKEYDITATPFQNGGNVLTAQQMTDIDNLLEVSDALNLDFGTERDSSGLGLAIWEVIYETSGSYSMDSGAFFATADAVDTGEVAAVAFANSLFALFTPGVAVGTNAYEAIYYESVNNESQNLIAIAAVPLPAAGLLLIAGLGGLGFVARRRGA